MGAHFLGLRNHHMAIHEYSRDPFIDARQNWGTWNARENYHTQATNAMAHKPIVMLGTKWLDWDRSDIATQNDQVAFLTRP
jgi:hypothetical protein